MIKTSYFKISCKLFQQANNKRYLYIKNLFYLCCLLTKVSFAQDSIYKKFYYPSGNVSSEGYFFKNVPTGKWTNYFANGNIKSFGYWKNALLDSNWIFFDIKGNKILEENYFENQKHGNVIKYDKNENQKQITNFKNGLKEGKEVIFFSNTRKINKINYYVNDKKHGVCFEYDKSLNIITITKYNMGIISNKEEINRRDRDGEKHGIWKEFYVNGKVKNEENYFHGVIDGITKKYNKKGGIEDIQVYKEGVEEKQKIKLDIKLSKLSDGKGNNLIGVVYNNKKNGLFKVFNSKQEIINYKFYRNDTLVREGMYDSIQQKSGKWIYYYSNSNIKKTGFYKKGKKDSLWQYYYKNGNIQQKGKYINNLPEGKWVWWYNNQQIKREEVYLKGKENGEVIELDSAGKILTKGNYSFGLREGEWLYVINDFKEEGIYISGMKTGLWKSSYLSTGNIKYVGEFLNDIPLNEHKEFYSNGKIKEIGKYKDGEKDGEWRKYDSSGEIIVTYLFKRGVEKRRDGFKVK
tara:strand:- start:535 stop:2091 length:1557 start_codon:yes stop_codon:yes gene_type:complete